MKRILCVILLAMIILASVSCSSDMPTHTTDNNVITTDLNTTVLENSTDTTSEAVWVTTEITAETTAITTEVITDVTTATADTTYTTTYEPIDTEATEIETTGTKEVETTTTVIDTSVETTTEITTEVIEETTQVTTTTVMDDTTSPTTDNITEPDVTNNSPTDEKGNINIPVRPKPSAPILNTEQQKIQNKVERCLYHLLYNNKSAEPAENVTKSEAVKLVVGFVENVRDASSIFYPSSAASKYNDYENHAWVEFIQMYEIIGLEEITKENESNLATKLEYIIILTKFIELDTEVEDFSGQLNFTNSYDLSEEEQKYLKFAVNLGILDNTTSYLDRTELLTKSYCNFAMVKIMEKYATPYYSPVEWGKDDVKIVTDESLWPSNWHEFPFIIDTIPKEAYEYDFIISNSAMVGVTKFCNPCETFTHKYARNLHSTIGFIEQYFDTFLNIDYNTVTAEKLLDTIEDTCIYHAAVYKENVDDYINYVKENEIILIGKATCCYPIFYSTGETYKIRVKVEFDVISTKTNKDILFGDIRDEAMEVRYLSNDNKYSFYMDFSLAIPYKGDVLRLDNVFIQPAIISENSAVYR